MNISTYFPPELLKRIEDEHHHHALDHDTDDQQTFTKKTFQLPLVL